MTAYWRDPNIWERSNLLKLIRKVFNDAANVYIRASDGRIAHPSEAQSLDSPWIFVRMDPCRHCALWNRVYFQEFGLIPSKCRFSCWKVVVKPSCVYDLFTLYSLLQHMDINGKCGLDVRDYTPDPYAGFVYNDSLKQGQRMLQEIRAALHNWHWIGGIPDSFLKRGCTEMEQKLPSDQWDAVTEDELETENALDEVFVKEETIAHSPQWIEQYRKQQWIKHAIRIGDLTWKQLVDDPMKWIPWTVRYDDEETFQKTMSPEGSRRALNNL